ncbi:hypothetical protein N1495_03690 [Streptococcus didelphis]|uniref:Uncharacterized protein n=1 Tax=Streptococcus didelphis TaxID=102886 RepID=A0ABY9LGT7_9STRE|nr:hypothetical protein [Streptococcus didelphis]WMB28072.1 hypothetical protein N1496_09135 [Streptococcus didelphis]WMB29983.1 hypothetical protein N1495_03690 [Streptococcus didelphis]
MESANMLKIVVLALLLFSLVKIVAVIVMSKVFFSEEKLNKNHQESLQEKEERTDYKENQ